MIFKDWLLEQTNNPNNYEFGIGFEEELRFNIKYSDLEFRILIDLSGSNKYYRTEIFDILEKSEDVYLFWTQIQRRIKLKSLLG